MKYLFLSAAALTMLAACSSGNNAEINISMPEDGAPKTIVVGKDLISDLASARQSSDLKTTYDTLEVRDGHIIIPTESKEAARYTIQFNDGNFADLYTSPGESLDMKITSYNPFIYSVSGSELMEDITELRTTTDSLYNNFKTLMDSGEVTMEQKQDFMSAYDKALADFVNRKPDSPAVIYALFELQGESFKNTYDNLTEKAKQSILMPIIADQVERMNEQSKEMEKIEREQAEKAKGDKDAPDFTLKNLEGKDVSLSDFRGKWVIIDFWGTWCGWCVKGIPALKEAYKRYYPKLEVISIDCNESEEEWREGVKQYQLNWVNVINNPGNPQKLLTEYSISGFPTKAIVNPEGKLVDLTTGEDPSFYKRLADFMK